MILYHPPLSIQWCKIIKHSQKRALLDREKRVFKKELCSASEKDRERRICNQFMQSAQYFALQFNSHLTSGNVYKAAFLIVVCMRSLLLRCPSVVFNNVKTTLLH